MSAPNIINPPGGGGGGGGGTVTGTGTPGKLAKFATASSIGDSLLSESDTTITSAATAETFNSAQTWTIGAPNSQALVVLSNAGAERTLVLDTISRAVGVGTPFGPGTLLHVHDGSGSAYAGSTYEGVRLQRATEALFSSSDYTRSFRAGLTGGTAVVGTSTAHDLLLQRGNVTAATLTSGAIATVTLTNGGAGYTDNTYSQQALTGGTGSGATADFVVAGGIITSCVLRSPGTGYAAADALSCATLGAGAGLVVTVATISQVVAGAGNVTALGRLGAGTATPRAGLDVQNEVAIFGGNSIVSTNNFSPSSIAGIGSVSVSAGTAVTGTGTQFTLQLQVGSSITLTTTSGSEVRVVQSITDNLNLVVTSAFAGTATNVVWLFNYPKYSFPSWSKIAIDPTISVVPTNLSSFVIAGAAYYDATNVTNGSFRYIYGGIVLKNLAAGWTGAASFISGGLNRTEPTDLNTAGVWFGSTVNTTVHPTCGSNTTATMTGSSVSVNNNKSGHTITTGTLYTGTGVTVAGATITTFSSYNAQLTNNGTIATSYGLRLQAPTGTGTITNRWGISQEDTLARNQFLGTSTFKAAVNTNAYAISSQDDVAIYTATDASGATNLRLASSLSMPQGAALIKATKTAVGSADLTFQTATGGALADQAKISSTGVLSFNSGYGSAAVAYGCRAWVNFNGTTTITIRASGGISSITRTSTGVYVTNLSVTMPDINYCITSVKQNVASNASCGFYDFIASRTTTSALFNCLEGAALADSANISISFFR